MAGRAAIAAAFLFTSVAAAHAFSSDRAAWLAHLQAERKARLAETARAPAAPQVGVQTGRVMPRGVLPQVARVAPAAPAATQQRGVRPASTQTRRITRQMDPKFLPTDVTYSGYKPGTIVIDTREKFLYHVGTGGKARRYGVGVGRPGFQWSGRHRVSMKKEWPGWTPPPAMRKRQPELPAYMPGGPENPLGARALYLGSTLYRIHGSNAPWTIGHEVSSGCIRMRNEDVTELYDRVKVGTQVVVVR
ncbi:MAG: L,D-transpeptidase [Pseudomonadota bacterium]